MNLTLPIVTGAALVDSVNPCAISVLLLTIGFLLSLRRSRSHITIAASLYILGIFLTYVFIGLGILRALTFFGTPKIISKVGALIIIFTGISKLLERFIPNYPLRLAIPSFSKPGIARLLNYGTLPALFLTGIVVGLFEFPCTGGPYLTILSLLHDTASYTQGFWYLLYYNLVFILPLVIIVAAFNIPPLFERIQKWRLHNSRSADIVSSLVMIALGLVILFLV